jgi:site-specific DNA-methyltransferase (adenine-specific)
MVELLNVDCMEYMRTCPDKKFDIAIVDPPYFDIAAKSSFYHGGKSKHATPANLKNEKHWDVPGQNYYDELVRVSKHQIIWGINYYDFHGVPPGRIFWFKDNLNSSFSDGEIASCTLINSVRFYKFKWNGFLQGDMKNKEMRIHKTQKPVALYAHLLNTYARPGWSVFDSHAGSFSSAVACINLGFSGVFTEIDPEHFKNGKSRVDKTRRQFSIFGHTTSDDDLKDAIEFNSSQEIPLNRADDVL